MKKNIVLTLMLALASASNAMAYSSTAGTVGSMGVTVAGTALVTAGTIEITNAMSGNAKDAVLKAQPDAVAVLKGSPASDAFVAAREAVEREAKIELGSDRQAAASLLEIAGAIEAGR